jgi:hypothetical protein
VIFTSHECVVGVRTFFWCVSVIELNAWKDEWLVNIGDLQEGENKNKKSDPKKTQFKEVMHLWAIYQYLQIGCKFKWENIKNHKPWFKFKFFLKIIGFSHFVVRNIFKVLFLISNCILLKDLIFWLNQLHVIMDHMFSTYHHYVSHLGFENFKILLCILLFKNSWSDSSEFLFHLFIQQLHFEVNNLSNNTLFMFWKMNLKLLLKFLTYKSWLQSVEILHWSWYWLTYIILMILSGNIDLT